MASAFEKSALMKPLRFVCSGPLDAERRRIRDAGDGESDFAALSPASPAIMIPHRQRRNIVRALSVS